MKRKTLKNGDAIKYIEKTLEHPLEVLGRFPKYFLIETTNICNARCVMCGIDFSKKQKAVMTDELFGRISTEIASYSDHVAKVMLYLDCEPLLDRGLAGRITQMKQGGVKKVNIASNAGLLDGAKAVEIIEAGLDEIYITLDSLRKEVYESIRRGLKFEKVYRNIVEFIKIRDELNPELAIRVQMILQEANCQEAESFTEHWSGLLGGRDQVVVQKAHNWGSTVETMKFGDEEAINDVPCIALWGTLCIHVDGQVGLCCMDTESAYPIGNLAQQSIAEIWKGEAMNEYRRRHLAGERAGIALCDGCTVWRPAKHEREQLLSETK